MELIVFLQNKCGPDYGPDYFCGPDVNVVAKTSGTAFLMDFNDATWKVAQMLLYFFQFQKLTLKKKNFLKTFSKKH